MINHPNTEKDLTSIPAEYTAIDTDIDTTIESDALTSVTQELSICDHFIFQELTLYNNPLMNACSKLLAFIVSITNITEIADQHQLRREIIIELQSIHNHRSLENYSSDLVEKCSFIIAIALNKAITNCNWCQQVIWSRQTLLFSAFSNNKEDDYFFDILEQALLQFDNCRDLIELQYVLLKLGFKIENNQKEQQPPTSEITRDLHKIINQQPKPIIKPKTPFIVTRHMPNINIPFPALFLILTLLIISLFMFTEVNYKYRSQETLDILAEINDLEAFRENLMNPTSITTD